MIFRFLEFPADYEVKLIGNYEDAITVCAKIPWDQDYPKISQALAESLDEQIMCFWDRGCIICEEEFAKKWDLTMTENKDLWRCEWDFPEINYSMSQFLNDRIEELPLVIYIQNPDEVREKGFDVVGDYVNVPADSIEELRKNMSLIF